MTNRGRVDPPSTPLMDLRHRGQQRGDSEDGCDGLPSTSAQVGNRARFGNSSDGDEGRVGQRQKPSIQSAWGSIRTPSQSPVMLGPAGRASSRRVAASQARTLELEIEVAAMEERLRMSRGLLPAS